MPRTQSVIVCFSEIFHYAEKEFNIGWNPCNDLFFDHAFNYRECNEWHGDELPKDFETMSKEEIIDLPDSIKANVITELFMISEGLQGKSVRIDSQ